MTFSRLGPWACIQNHYTLMCFEVHTNNFLTILMFADQFDSLFFVSRQPYRPKLKICIGYMLLLWCFTTLEREEICFFPLFSMLKKTWLRCKSELSFLFSMYMKYYLTYLFLPYIFVTFSYLGPWTCLNKLCSKFEVDIKKMRFLCNFVEALYKN